MGARSIAYPVLTVAAVKTKSESLYRAIVWQSSNRQVIKAAGDVAGSGYVTRYHQAASTLADSRINRGIAHFKILDNGGLGFGWDCRY